MPPIVQQIVYILIIAVAMVFGSFLYRKRHDDSARKGSVGAPARTRPERRKRPRKKR